MLNWADDPAGLGQVPARACGVANRQSQGPALAPTPSEGTEDVDGFRAPHRTGAGPAMLMASCRDGPSGE